MKKNLLFLRLIFFGLVMLFSSGRVKGQSYLGLNGGFEGNATIDNSVNSTPQAEKWTKNNATQSIADEIVIVRSGAHSLSINNTSTTGRRVWSPLISTGSQTTGVTIQYYRRVANATNSQSNQEGVLRASESLQGTYDTPAANIWEKQTYSPASQTFTTITGVIMHRMIGTGGNMYIDDMCIYAGGVDITPPDPSTSSVVSTPTTSSTSLNVSWTAPGAGIDGGGYIVVRGTTDPTTAPNVNGIYAVNNTIAAGMTVVYQGTGTSFVDSGLSSSTTYYYRIYTYDKAYNYSTALTGNGTTLSETNWTGATDNDWTTAGNWTSGVPSSSYNVTIPTGNNVTISSSTSANCNNLTLEGNATLTIVSDQTNSGSLIFNGTYTAGTGTVTYQRYMTGSKWHMTGSPLSGQSINSSFLSTNSIAGMKHYNETTNAFVDSYNGSEGYSISLGKGYAVKLNSDGVVSLIGSPNNITPTVTLTKGGYGWNLLANPYTSAISVESLISGNSDKLHPSFGSLYIWDETGTYDGSQNYYKAVTLDDYYDEITLSHLQVGQAFFVRAKDGGESFQITPAMQSHQTTASFKSEPINNWRRIILNAEISNAKASTRISYNENMTNGLDIGYDAGLLNSYPTFALYSKLIEDNGSKFMVQCLPTDFENLVVPIGLDAQAGEIVKFSAQSANLPDNYKIILEDRTLGVFTNLSEANAEYSIQLINESKGSGRFFVRTSMESALGIGDLDNESPYKVFTRPNHNQIVIRGIVNANTIARIYTISGKQIADIHLKQSNESLVQFNEETGVYIVKISNEKGTTTQKFVWVK